MTSPPQPDPADAVRSADRLSGALNGLSQRLDTVKQDSEARDQALAEYGRASRHRIWLTYALFAVDITLTVVVSVFAVQAHNAASSASQNKQASVASCAAGNDLRATLDQVFDHVFEGVAAPASDTPAQRAAETAKLKGLEAYYHAKFASRNCAVLYDVTPAASPAGTGR